MISPELNKIIAQSTLTKIVTGCLVLGLSACTTTNMYSTKSSEFLTDNAQMTLYTFDKDSQGQSSCYEQCATNWPPYFANNGEAKSEAFSKITRKDGSQQWAHNGNPLYYWKFDQQPGDAKGNGIGGVWHVVNLGTGRSQNNKSGSYSNSDY